MVFGANTSTGDHGETPRRQTGRQDLQLDTSRRTSAVVPCRLIGMGSRTETAYFLVHRASLTGDPRRCWLAGGGIRPSQRRFYL